VLYADYEIGFAIIEFIGEWNDAIENDIMTLKRELIDKMLVLWHQQIHLNWRKCIEFSQQ